MCIQPSAHLYIVKDSTNQDIWMLPYPQMSVKYYLSALAAIKYISLSSLTVCKAFKNSAGTVKEATQLWFYYIAVSGAILL